jgi:hypothetical protein
LDVPMVFINCPKQTLKVFKTLRAYRFLFE